MKKLVHVSVQRPVQGIVVFTLKGTDAEKDPTYSGAFKNTHALVSLVPNTEEGTYYEYAVYAQWYECTGLVSKQIEKGYCIVPEFDSVLDSITVPEPVKENPSTFYDAIEELKDRVEILEEFKDNKPELLSSVSGSFNCTDDAPILTLKSVKDTGEEVSQSVDMSCLSEMMDSKLESIPQPDLSAFATHTEVNAVEDKADTALQDISRIDGTVENIQESIAEIGGEVNTALQSVEGSFSCEASKYFLSTSLYKFSSGKYRANYSGYTPKIYQLSSETDCTEHEGFPFSTAINYQAYYILSNIPVAIGSLDEEAVLDELTFVTTDAYADREYSLFILSGSIDGTGQGCFRNANTVELGEYSQSTKEIAIQYTGTFTGTEAVADETSKQIVQYSDLPFLLAIQSVKGDSSLYFKTATLRVCRNEQSLLATGADIGFELSISSTDGTVTTQTIDMSCLADMMDDKVSNTLTEVTGSFSCGHSCSSLDDFHGFTKEVTGNAYAYASWEDGSSSYNAGGSVPYDRTNYAVRNSGTNLMEEDIFHSSGHIDASPADYPYLGYSSAWYGGVPAAQAVLAYAVDSQYEYAGPFGSQPSGYGVSLHRSLLVCRHDKAEAGTTVEYENVIPLVLAGKPDGEPYQDWAFGVRIAASITYDAADASGKIPGYTVNEIKTTFYGLGAWCATFLAAPVALTLTSTQTNGASVTQTIDMSCLSDMMDDKIEAAVPDLSAYALDANVVHKTGAETVAGTKTFSSTISGNISGSAAKLTTARSLTISDADGSHTGDAVTFDGSADKTLKLPSIISADITGNAASADTLNSDNPVSDNKPYVFRPSGGGLDIAYSEYDGAREIDKLVGGTVNWNQLVRNGNFEDGTTGWTVVRGSIAAVDGVLSYTVTTAGNSRAGNRIDSAVYPATIGHRLLVSADVNISQVSKEYYSIDIFSAASTSASGMAAALVNKRVYPSDGWVNISGISTVLDATAAGVISTKILFAYAIAADVIQVRNCMSIDLTALFGTEIADYIYSLEQANAGAGVAWFRKLFPKDYYAYNTGELMSVQAASHDMVGFNQWDEEWEVGKISTSTGVNSADITCIRSKNYIPIISGQTYYIKCPVAAYIEVYNVDKNYMGRVFTKTNQTFTLAINDNATDFASSIPGFIRFYCQTGGTYTPGTICINFSHSGYRNGEYEPYAKHSYPLDSSLTLRGVPKLDASGNLYYDGDTYSSDGTVERRYAELTNQTGAVGDTITLTGLDMTATDIITSAGRLADVGTLNGDVLTLSVVLSGASIVYPLAESTTETAEPYQNPQVVDDFGTEQYVDAGDRDVAIPVGHETKYLPNLVDKLRRLPSLPEATGDYIVHYDMSTGLSSLKLSEAGAVQVSTGLVEENGVVRLALLKSTSFGDGQIEINIVTQHDTPYSYDDDEDVYEYNPSPYVIDLSQNANRFNSATLSFGKFMMTQEQVDALKPYLKSVLAHVYRASGTVNTVTYVLTDDDWAANGFIFYMSIPSRSTAYPSVEIFDTIERLELVMTTSTDVSHPRGNNIGTYFPAGTNIYLNGTYWG